MNLEIRTKELALIAIYAALYAALVIVLGGFSFGPIKFESPIRWLPLYPYWA
jgi:uncharacterized membrane protein